MIHRYFWRAVLLCALSAPVAAPVPALADGLRFDAGDVQCLDYQPGSHSCAMLRRVQPRQDRRLAISDEIELFYEGLEFTIAVGFIATPTRSGLCIDPGSVRASSVPESNDFARGVARTEARKLRAAARGGACITHHRCGPDAVAALGRGQDRIWALRLKTFDGANRNTRILTTRKVGPATIAHLRMTGFDDCRDIPETGGAFDIFDFTPRGDDAPPPGGLSGPAPE